MRIILLLGVLVLIGCRATSPKPPQGLHAGMAFTNFQTNILDHYDNEVVSNTDDSTVYRLKPRTMGVFPSSHQYEVRIKEDKVDSYGTVKALEYNQLPRIHAIGSQSTITYESHSAPGPHRAITIPIEGKNLEFAGKENIGVKVTGTVPLIEKDDYEWELEKGAGSSDWIILRIFPSYLRKVKNGDQIDVQVDLRRKGDFDRPVCFATRKFTLYDTDYYREHIQATRVPIHDIQAFPLPEEEAKYLFGRAVSQNYFVVRLSVRNTRKDDKLVSTGMIVASGRALVIPENADPNSFTIPVSISPQSTVHMYSILEDRERWHSRTWTFRSLEFVGALATVAATSYGVPAGGPIPDDVGTGTALFTGVFIPEFKRFWPDPWPGYKRNLVAYGMPELVKVPKNAVSNQKYLFFSKEKIEAIIADQTLYGEKNLLLGRNKKKQPEVRVISLAFDHLDIPFEQVLAPQDLDVKDRIFELQSTLSTRIQDLGELRSDLRRGMMFTNLTPARIEQLSATCSDILTKIQGEEVTNLASKVHLQNAVTNLSLVLQAFRDSKPKSILFEDVPGQVPGMKQLERHRDYLTRLQKRLLQYSDAVSSDSLLSEIENSISLNERATSALFHAGEVLGSAELNEALTALNSTAELNNNESKWREIILRLYYQIREESTGLNLWPQVTLAAIIKAVPVAPGPAQDAPVDSVAEEPQTQSENK